MAGLEAPLAAAATISQPGPAPATRQTLIVDTDFYPGLLSPVCTSYKQSICYEWYIYNSTSTILNYEDKAQ